MPRLVIAVFISLFFVQLFSPIKSGPQQEENSLPSHSSTEGLAMTDAILRGRLQSAKEVYIELIGGADSGIPEWLQQNANCITVLPDAIGAAFFAGAKVGKGVASCRSQDDATWSPPLFVKLASGSLGWQIGADSIDLVLFMPNENAKTLLLRDRVTFGVDATIAAGPVGRSAEGHMNLNRNTIYAYSRAKGLFVGISANGTILSADEKANQDFYRRDGLTAAEILNAKRLSSLPQEGAEFISMLPK